ncbi:hypothetical protein DOTSEDRAFT_71210 [Dothistroma septosporum NZE10]|uniref:GPI anchored protein n=1 Tax=Dothistroma septosporum (strain NZE10 / CBS 128990) TaxID=675120 RepID=N1PSL1_DOTSN|nr:hypothetical protein DOTSEDRAFT_71210 [Dothistroma septosporum NZE10]
MNTIIAITLACAATTAAQSAIIVVEASHGGAGQGLTNTTLTIPLGERYQSSALHTVSTLYLTGAEGVPLNSITCTPYRNNNLTGAGGLPFTSTRPSSLSTNTAQVGSLVCNSTVTTSSGSSSSSIASTTSTISGSRTVPGILTPVVTNSTTRVPNATSTLLRTVAGSAQSTFSPSMVTSTAIFSGSDGPQTSVITNVVDGATTSDTAPPSLNTQRAAAAAVSGDRTVFRAALLGVGLLALL